MNTHITFNVGRSTGPTSDATGYYPGCTGCGNAPAIVFRGAVPDGEDPVAWAWAHAGADIHPCACVEELVAATAAARGVVPVPAVWHLESPECGPAIGRFDGGHIELAGFAGHSDDGTELFDGARAVYYRGAP